MTEDEALLAAIAASPNADTPRLAYADWLDEHDLPLRAELIRLQCAIASLDESSHAVRNANVALWRRQQDLLEFHREELLGPLADVVKPLDAVFERGFLTEITLTDEAFISHGEYLVRFQPKPIVHVKSQGEHLQALTQRFYAPLVNILEVHGHAHWDGTDARYDGYYDTSRASFFHAIRPWPLEVLTLWSCSLQDADLLALENGSALPALRTLDLSWNRFSDEGIRRLIALPFFPRLEYLGVSGNPITDTSAELLAEAPGKLKFLNVANTNITVLGQQALLCRKGTEMQLF